MTRIYNKTELKDTRRKLRKEQTYAEKVAWITLRDRNSWVISLEDNTLLADM